MISIRQATLSDTAVIAAQRRAMFADMGYRDDGALDAMTREFLPWLTRKMESGDYLAWLAVDSEGDVVAGAGLWLMDWPPHMIGRGSRRGNILNVYTRHDHRRQGWARKLTEAALEWCRSHAIGAVILHASNDGRALYQSLGFQASNEMRMLLPVDK